MNPNMQKVGELIKFEGYDAKDNYVVVTGNSICVSIEPLVGVSQSDIYPDMLDVYNFNTEEFILMSKSALLKVIQGETL